MVTAILGSRSESWRLQAITPAGDHVASLALVPDSGSHDWEVDRRNPLGLTCEVDAPSVSLSGLWLRITHIIGTEPHVMATCVVSDVERVLGRGERWRIQATDPTYVLSDLRALRHNLVLPAGTPVVSTVRSLLALYAPGLRVVVGDSDHTLRSEMAWPAGTDLLTVINALLGAITFTPLAPDPLGVLHSSLWTPVDDRPAVLVLGTDAGLDAPFVGQATLTAATHLPTEVIAVGQGSDAVVGRWPDHVPVDPVTEVIRGDWATVGDASLAARRHMEERSAEGRRTAVTGPWQPVIPGQIAAWSWPRHDITMRAEVIALDCRWGKGSPTTYQLQEVAW